MKTFKELITEIFDFNLPLEKFPEMESYINNNFGDKLKNVECYKTTHQNTPYHFIRFKHNNAREVHFAPTTPDFNKRTQTNKGSGASKLVGTAVSLYKDKFLNKEPIRYYGDPNDPSLMKLYDKTFDYLNKTHKLNIIKKPTKHTDVNGFTHNAIEIHHNKD